MTDETVPPRRRLRMLLAVAAVVLVLDVVTKVVAVKFLTPGQPVPIIGDTVTWTLVRNSGGGVGRADFLIAPKTAGRTYIRFSRYEELVLLGRQAARERLPLLQRILAEQRLKTTA